MYKQVVSICTHVHTHTLLLFLSLCLSTHSIPCVQKAQINSLNNTLQLSLFIFLYSSLYFSPLPFFFLLSFAQPSVSLRLFVLIKLSYLGSSMNFTSVF